MCSRRPSDAIICSTDAHRAKALDRDKSTPHSEGLDVALDRGGVQVGVGIGEDRPVLQSDRVVSLGTPVWLVAFSYFLVTSRLAAAESPSWVREIGEDSRTTSVWLAPNAWASGLGVSPDRTALPVWLLICIRVLRLRHVAFRMLCSQTGRGTTLGGWIRCCNTRLGSGELRLSSASSKYALKEGQHPAATPRG